jgi:hypothetical protein
MDIGNQQTQMEANSQNVGHKAWQAARGEEEGR